MFNMPMHTRKKGISSNLSKELRKKHSKRSMPLRKGDTVKILRGKFKGKKGKVTEIKIKTMKIIVENIQIKKQDGSKSNFPLKASNLQIVEINLEDKKRGKRLKNKQGTQNKEKTHDKNEDKSKEIKNAP